MTGVQKPHTQALNLSACPSLHALPPVHENGIYHIPEWQEMPSCYIRLSSHSAAKKAKLVTLVRLLGSSDLQKVEWWVLGAGRGRMGSWYLMGTEFQFGNEKVLGINGDNS
jgi:hypothetical protein